MKKSHLFDIFKDYDDKTQRILREVLLLEQQYITEPLRTNSSALKELRDKIDKVIEQVNNS